MRVINLRYCKTLYLSVVAAFFSFFSSGIISAVYAYELLNAKAYQRTVLVSRHTIQQWLKVLNQHQAMDANAKIAWIVQVLLDRPYTAVGATGEGDWLPSAKHYQGGAIHIIQDPVYRTDSFDCQTFVQLVIALLHAKNRDDFEKNILQIGYGAARNPQEGVVHYYNRNHFIEGDFNPINERDGRLMDVTASGTLATYTKQTAATLTRQQWFLRQTAHLNTLIRVLDQRQAPAMQQRYLTVYQHLDFPHFNEERVSMTYLPKEVLVARLPHGEFEPNQTLLRAIPTPAVVEIVHDAKRWRVDGQSIKTVLGTELMVSHMGILYRQDFRHGELIYPKTDCHKQDTGHFLCAVTPIYCQKMICHELMLAHATDAYPLGYVWYQTTQGQWGCASAAPHGARVISTCNRVERQPFLNYLTASQSGLHWFMDRPSIIGIHLEKML